MNTTAGGGGGGGAGKAGGRAKGVAERRGDRSGWEHREDGSWEGRGDEVERLGALVGEGLMTSSLSLTDSFSLSLEDSRECF